MGTSLDGVNLDKGNNAGFLKDYPPPPGEDLDRYDSQLNRGMHFTDEWSFDRYHEDRAWRFIRSHPAATARADLLKADVLLLSIHRYGSAATRGAMKALVLLGNTAFRLVLWAAIACAVWGMATRGGPGRRAGWIFLALVAAVCLPYLVGFAYTRHASVLIYPSVLLCCRSLARAKSPVRAEAPSLAAI